jgi:pimeloyl-ACP methyl ester carboxylesterase
LGRRLAPRFGYSDRSAQGAYARADQARRLAGLIRNLNLQNAIIVGHSFGAGATVETVMRNPALFKGMVLVAGALALPRGRPAQGAEVRQRPLVSRF